VTAFYLPRSIGVFYVAVRELVTKGTLLNELHGIPDRDVGMVLRKVSGLLKNPVPDGRSKRKLVTFEGIYRLRAGDYRLLYTFGPTWVRILRLIPRKDAYSGDLRVEGDFPDDFPDDGDFEDALTAPLGETADTTTPLGSVVPVARRRVPRTTDAHPTGRPLEQPITTDGLASLKVAPEYSARAPMKSRS
jgi:mRNA-degrading endonuclease RelE of RelBE toxin-antitoxin system